MQNIGVAGLKQGARQDSSWDVRETVMAEREVRVRPFGEALKWCVQSGENQASRISVPVAISAGSICQTLRLSPAACQAGRDGRVGGEPRGPRVKLPGRAVADDGSRLLDRSATWITAGSSKRNRPTGSAAWRFER